MALRGWGFELLEIGEMEKNNLDLIKKTTEELLNKLQIETSVSVSKDKQETAWIDISGENLGVLIGFHGETLGALQLILSLMIYRKLRSWQQIVVDVGDWRKKREEALKKLAKRTAERVKFSEEEQELPSMSSFERRIVHLALSEDSQVGTESVGEGSERHVVVKPRKK